MQSKLMPMYKTNYNESIYCVTIKLLQENEKIKDACDGGKSIVGVHFFWWKTICSLGIYEAFLCRTEILFVFIIEDSKQNNTIQKNFVAA